MSGTNELRDETVRGKEVFSPSLAGPLQELFIFLVNLSRLIEWMQSDERFGLRDDQKLFASNEWVVRICKMIVICGATEKPEKLPENAQLKPAVLFLVVRCIDYVLGRAAELRLQKEVTLPSILGTDALSFFWDKRQWCRWGIESIPSDQKLLAEKEGAALIARAGLGS